MGGRGKRERKRERKKDLKQVLIHCLSREMKKTSIVHISVSLRSDSFRLKNLRSYLKINSLDILVEKEKTLKLENKM